jgi:heme/copper-type cytochrome/quinol oxidase subunit 4
MDAAAQPPAKRPKVVWVVFLFYLFSVGYTALSFYLVLSGLISVAPEQATYIRNLSAFDWAITGLTATLNLAGAISIFLLRKIAFPLFAISLALSILLTLVHAFTTNLTAALGGSGAIGIAIGYAISIVVCTYAWKLKARGVLL